MLNFSGLLIEHITDFHGKWKDSTKSHGWNTSCGSSWCSHAALELKLLLNWRRLLLTVITKNKNKKQINSTQKKKNHNPNFSIREVQIGLCSRRGRFLQQTNKKKTIQTQKLPTRRTTSLKNSSCGWLIAM